jgi:hypothetical protein
MVSPSSTLAVASMRPRFPRPGLLESVYDQPVCSRSREKGNGLEDETGFFSTQRDADVMEDESRDGTRQIVRMKCNNNIGS